VTELSLTSPTDALAALWRPAGVLGCEHERAAVAGALQAWRAEAFEQAAADAGLVVTLSRSFAEWDSYPQGRAVAARPVIGIERIGDAPPSPLPPAERPLGGIRVLYLTRVIAGPVCGRTRPAGRMRSGFGRLTAVRHAAVLSETPARWERPAVPVGSHPPAWPAAN
jgi:hypothetical protein